MTYRHINPKPLTPALGAEIEGVNIADRLSDDVIDEIHRAFLEHQVIFLRNQALDPESLLAFGRRFGELDRYPFVAGLDDYPEVVEVVKKEHETINFGGLWHSDTSYLEIPPKASMLYGRTIPPVGGDTLFASMYLAYESLSEGLQKALEGLAVLNSSRRRSAAITRTHRAAERPAAAEDTIAEAIHPLVRTHPDTGRRALYCSDAHTMHIEGMTEEESAPLLQHLYRVQQRPEFCCRFRWRPGSLAFWDNRCTQHNALNDYHGYRREMYRITLAGERPV